MHERPPGVRVLVPLLTWEQDVLFRGLSLDLEAGLWSCLLGPSGCGKTSLLRIIAGLLEGGLVRADDDRPIAGRLAYMAQSDLLLPWLPIRENVLLGYRLRRAGRAEMALRRDEATALIERVGLAGYGAALPQTLSGGMRQRAALARTLMEDRPVVLMDEPFSSLDAITRHRLQDLAAELLDGRTVLLVTHSPLEAVRLGDRVFLMAGRPARLDEPLDLPGKPPRDAGSPEVLALQADLLSELTASAAALEAPCVSPVLS